MNGSFLPGWRNGPSTRSFAPWWRNAPRLKLKNAVDHADRISSDVRYSPRAELRDTKEQIIKRINNLFAGFQDLAPANYNQSAFWKVCIGAIPKIFLILSGLLLLQGFKPGLTDGLSTAEPCDKRPHSSEVSRDDPQKSKSPKACILSEIWNPTSMAVTWNSDGSRFASLSYDQGVNALTIWNADGQVFRKIPRPFGGFFHQKGLAFIAHDNEIVMPPVQTSEGQKAFDVIDIESGKIIREELGRNPGLTNESNSITGLAVTPDQTTLAVMYGHFPLQPVDVYDTGSWKKVVTLPPPSVNLSDGRRISETPEHLTFSHDGKLLAVGGSGNVLIYDWKAMRLVQVIENFGGLSAFSPDNSLIAVANTHLNEGRRTLDGKLVPIGREKAVRIFRIADGAMVSFYPDSLPWIKDMAWSSDGRTIALIAGGGGAVGDLSTLLGPEDKVLPLICSSLRLWEPLSADSIPLTIALRGNCASGGLTLAFSPDSKLLAVDNNQYLTVYSIQP